MHPLSLPTPHPQPAQPREEKRRPRAIALTRRTGFDDGFGAQLQRVIATYCICKEYGFDYVHTPLANIEYQGLQSLLEQKNSADFVRACNSRIEQFIRSSDNVPSTSEGIGRKYEQIDADLPLEHLDQLKRRLGALKRNGASSTRSRALVRYAFPFVISDAHPHVYRHARGLFGARQRGGSNGGAAQVEERFTLVIGLHVRRGELYVVDSDRMLPNAFYLDMASRVIRACDALGVAYVVELYTEVASHPTTVEAFPGTGKRLQAPKTYEPNGAEALHEFDMLRPRLRRCVNEPLLTTFDRMIDCDVLVMSRSSLSACAAYLKPASGLVLYHPFWHEMLSPEDGHVPCDAPDLDARCERFVREFSEGRAGAYVGDR